MGTAASSKHIFVGESPLTPIRGTTEIKVTEESQISPLCTWMLQEGNLIKGPNITILYHGKHGVYPFLSVLFTLATTNLIARNSGLVIVDKEGVSEDIIAFCDEGKDKAQYVWFLLSWGRLVLGDHIESTVRAHLEDGTVRNVDGMPIFPTPCKICKKPRRGLVDPLLGV